MSSERRCGRTCGWRRWAVGALAALTASAAAAAPATTTIASIDLAKPFATRSAWRLTATQGPPVDSPAGLPGEKAPGLIALCLSDGAACAPDLQSLVRSPTFAGDAFTEAHYLIAARVVSPGAGEPLLFIQTGSFLSGDGDQVVTTQALAYERASDRFRPVYRFVTGHNNDQEVRFIAAGPLRGDIISVEPTADKPYGFWVTVNRLTPAYAYQQVLRYRSATGYGDGNPLAVIDLEMANIESRLGLWHAGQPLPVPAGSCPAPRLVHMELWCQPRAAS